MLWGLRNHQNSIINVDFQAKLQNSDSAGLVLKNLHFYKYLGDIDASDPVCKNIFTFS